LALFYTLLFSILNQNFISNLIVFFTLIVKYNLGMACLI
jgi:hypothetical protein